jgi:hypothetical protein
MLNMKSFVLPKQNSCKHNQRLFIYLQIFKTKCQRNPFQRKNIMFGLSINGQMMEQKSNQNLAASVRNDKYSNIS